MIIRKMVTIQNQDNTSLYCAELHGPYENVVAAGQNPSPQVILHGFLPVIMNAIHNNIGNL